MSKSDQSKVFIHDGEDPAMRRASEKARETFRYFWRENAWERRRIVPALEVSCVKAAFSDGDPSERRRDKSDHPQVEQMWIGDVDFDGKAVSGTLLNSPNWLTSVKQGDTVVLPLAEISDWMYATEGKVYGAFTVQLLRSRMEKEELEEHDEAWGMDFGDATNVRVVPAEKAFEGPDHPMSAGMGDSLRKAIANDPTFLTSRDDRGWTMLHHLALAGSITGVKVLLEAGADATLRTADRITAADLARTLGWEEVARILETS